MEECLPVFNIADTFTQYFHALDPGEKHMDNDLKANGWGEGGGG